MNCSLARMAAAAALLLTIAAPQAQAQQSITPYIWTTGVHADVKLNGSKVVDADVPFSDLVKDVNVALMLRYGAFRGRWGALADLFYVGMSTKGADVTLPDGTPAKLDADLDLAVFDATASYSLHPNRHGLSFIAGTRVVYDGAALDLTIPTSSTTSITQTTESSDLLFNGIVGLHYRRPLTSRLAVEARGDVGTGETELTWSGSSVLNIALGKSRRHAFQVGYKTLTVEFREENSVQTGMSMSGLVTGFRFAF